MMSRMIQAYFHTENQAEGAKALLMKYDPQMLEVGSLEGGYNGSGRLLLPFMESGGLVNEANINNSFAMVDAPPAAARASSDYASDGDTQALHYVLSCKVADANYLGAAEIIRRNHGHLEEFND
ncbi:hypothetical protein GQF01_18880 [Paenibacillus sp. 5J-6]|uniref:Uncharacterized protein n=2 Tax=Paenibacillus silvestris TaxID=2606219 RepID=A0A6L8V135_9BACL|nr:hypothetical protein [Paenibacillus silvestris]